MVNFFPGQGHKSCKLNAQIEYKTMRFARMFESLYQDLLGNTRAHCVLQDLAYDKAV